MKRRFLLPAVVLTAAIALFGTYQLWVHKAKDTTAPVITVEEGILECKVEDTREKLLTGVTAWDDRDGDVTASLLVESVYGMTEDHVTTVTYAAFDRAGNVAKIQRQVRYQDYREPRFEVTDSLTFPSTGNVDILDYIGATDVLEGDIRRRVRATLVSDTGSIKEVGTHIVRLQVTNSLGDTVEKDIPVEVYDPEWYTASVELSEYLIYVKKGTVFHENKYLDAFVVRGDRTDLKHGVPADVHCRITGSVDTDVPGVYSLRYELSRNVNLTTFAGIAILTVIVVE